MSDLLLTNHDPDPSGLIHRVTPESASWKHVGFCPSSEWATFKLTPRARKTTLALR